MRMEVGRLIAVKRGILFGATRLRALINIQSLLLRVQNYANDGSTPSFGSGYGSGLIILAI